MAFRSAPASRFIGQGQAELKTLLMSCRVIGREVEIAFLGAVLKPTFKPEGVETLTASYIPTQKNVIVADFYAPIRDLEKDRNDRR